jgi:hypothetical protein
MRSVGGLSEYNRLSVSAGGLVTIEMLKGLTLAERQEQQWELYIRLKFWTT